MKRSTGLRMALAPRPRDQPVINFMSTNSKNAYGAEREHFQKVVVPREQPKQAQRRPLNKMKWKNASLSSLINLLPEI